MATPSPGAALLALAVPLTLFHTGHQPGISFGAAAVDVYLSDVALLALAGAVAASLLRHGPPPIGRARLLWLAGAAFLAWIAIGTLLPTLRDQPYDATTHLVTAAKYAEYAVLAVAVPVLARSREERELVLVVLVGWAAAAALVGTAQFLGADVFDAWAAGRRQPSFLGHHDFAGLAATAYAIGLGCLALGRRRRLALLGCVAGGIGLVVSGSVAGLLGLGLALAAALLVARGRKGAGLPRAGRALGAATAGVAVVALLVVAFRGNDLNDFLRFTGLLDERQEERAVETYSHRTLLAYLGLRIWRDHPVAGAGWQASREYELLRPYLPDARARFPDVPDEAFPRPGFTFGVQNAWVQALSDLGVIGFALFGLLLGGGAWLGVAAALRSGALPALAGAGTVLVAAALWTAQGLVPGLGMDSLTWLGLGLVAAEASRG